MPLLDQAVEFRLCNRQDHPILRIVAVCPVNRLSENRDETLITSRTGQDHDVEVRFIDQFFHRVKALARYPRVVRVTWPAMLATEVLPLLGVAHPGASRCDQADARASSAR